MSRNHFYIITLLVISALATICKETCSEIAFGKILFAEQQHITYRYRGAVCIASLCVTSDLPAETLLVSKHGPGWVSKDWGGVRHCYVVQEGKAFLQVEIEEEESNRILLVLVSRDPSCPESVIPKGAFGNLTTPEGIGLGSSVEKLIALYGKPDIQRKADSGLRLKRDKESFESTYFGDEVLIYGSPDDKLLYSGFYVRNSKVSAFLVSFSE